MINLYSDTQTKPSAAMRQAMANADVGDEQRGEDPTVNALTARVATLLGKEAAVFMPSGTMCNEIALMVHCRPGDEILCDRTSHILNYEAGGPAALAGAVMTPIDGPRGVFTADQLQAAIRPDHRYGPRTRVVEIENTANMAGGTVWTLDQVNAVTATAKAAGLVVHMDGARLMNAVVASGVAAADYARDCDSVWIDFSKGLGAPVGAALAGSKDFIDEVWRWKQRMGGAMRQAGIIAAGALYALDHNIQQLADDNGNAATFAGIIAASPAFEIDPLTVDSNIVIFGMADGGDAAAFVARAEADADVRIGAVGPSTLRAVTHLDADASAVRTAADRIVGLAQTA
ncbi:MAG: threonine aldolase family protein [Alphaproteobacteria bacterium]